MLKNALLLPFLMCFAATAEEPRFVPPLKGDVASDYGVRSDPFLGRPAMHTGLDFSASTGDPVTASQTGVVIKAGWDRDYGRLVEICENPDGKGWCTRYGHNSEIDVKVGDKVVVGQKIAEVGTTGRSTGPHAHFEILKDKKRVDPMEYMDGFHFGMSDLDKIAEENRKTLEKFQGPICEITAQPGDENKSDDELSKERQEKDKQREAGMNGLKALKIMTRAGWHTSMLPLSVKRDGHKVSIELFSRGSSSVQKITFEENAGSDAIMKWEKKNIAIKPRMTLASVYSHVSDICYAAFVMNRHFEERGQKPEVIAKPDRPITATATN